MAEFLPVEILPKRTRSARDREQPKCYTTMIDLATKDCIPCRGGVPPLTAEEIVPLQKLLGGEWSVMKEHHLEKEFRFNNFREALDFTNRVGEIAEEQGHHPDIHLSWGYVKIEIWTHKIDGLTESDFILAAKIDKVVVGRTFS